MVLLLAAILAVVVLCTLYVTLPVAMETFKALSGPRLVMCPANARLTEVELDARLGALTSAFGIPLLRIKNCAEWPQRSGCAQGCIAAVDALNAQRHGLLTRPFGKPRSKQGEQK